MVSDERLMELIRCASDMADRFTDGVLMVDIDAPVMVEMCAALCKLQQILGQRCETCKTQQGCLGDGWPAHDGFYCGHWQDKEAE